jgi:thiol-disulfide isomerase/thioredoxin
VALFAGGLAWGLTGGALSLIENQTSRPPETELYTLEGTPTDLASLQQNAGNRPMVVNLWATWCPPCREEMPVLEQAQDERTDVLFVFANQREVVPTIRKFMDQMQLDMDHVVRDPRGGIGSQAGSAALPTTLFYNANGRLVDSHLGQLSKATLARALERFDLPSTESTQAKELP